VASFLMNDRRESRITFSDRMDNGIVVGFDDGNMPSTLRARAASPNSLKNRSQLNELAAVPIKIRLKSYDAISSPVVR
jgi:hypothetical protein